MAGREKKLFAGRKQASASPVPPKETVAPPETSPKIGTSKTESPSIEDAFSKLTTIKSAVPKAANNKTIVARSAAVLAKKLNKPIVRKTIGKALTVNLKTKNKKPVKIKKQLAKVLLNSAKTNLECKKTALLQNGVKQKRIRKTKTKVQADVVKLEKEQDDNPPVLEPMLPLKVVEKKSVKKRVKKVPVTTDDNPKKTKSENNDHLSSIDETINSILNKITTEGDPKVSKKGRTKKIKVETTETIEDVMNDLSCLIKNEDEKLGLETSSESCKTEPSKQKKTGIRKSKVDLLKKRAFKKENVENNIRSLDASAKHLIDMLDLSVQKSDKRSLPMSNRRHSIEKFHIDLAENLDALNASSAFNSIPRAITPKSKRASRVRQSVDASLSVRRYSPYGTRSDASNKILRNGKHRKLKDTLFDGINIEYKRRKRLCSDFSGSEKSMSKLSGYESDSSFSDMSSFHGTENLDQKDVLVKIELTKKESTDNLEQINAQDNVNNKSINSKNIKRSLSIEDSSNCINENSLKNENFTDNNYNLCNDLKLEVPTMSKDNYEEPNLEQNGECSENTGKNLKVPEKSIILDIMKQTFNDMYMEDPEKRTTRSSTKKVKSDDDKSITPISVTNHDITNETSIETDSQTQSANDETQPELKLDEDNLESYANDFEQTKETNGHVNSELVDSDMNISDDKTDDKAEVKETPENLAIKENILQALGLQSLKAAEEAKSKGKTFKNDYTGTLKTVIKLNRCEKKKGRNTLKITLQKHKPRVVKETEEDAVGLDEEQGQKTLKEATSNVWRSHMTQSSDTAGALRKSHYSNRSNNMDGSSEHTSDGDTATADGEDSGKVLVIPEKASSFSIHPGRLCKDECSYCFGKFGLFDTPCHIAQMKSVERQNKILQTEKHLMRDSCLCDACYRHVDRKSNTPSYLNKGSKRHGIVAPGPRQNHCHVLNCNEIASNILRRKWLIKMRKSVCQVINIDLDNPGLHSIPICNAHYNSLEHLMICAMCKRRLARNHIHYLGPEMTELNAALNKEGIPVKLIDKPVVCKLCRYFASLLLKSREDRPDNTNTFYEAYKKRLLHFNDVEVMDDTTAEEPIPVPAKDNKIVDRESIKKKKKLQKLPSSNGPPMLEPQVELDKPETQSSSNSRSESPSDYMVDYNTLIPSIAMECGSDVETSKPLKKFSRTDSLIKEAVEISKTLNQKSDCDNNKSSAIAVQRLGSNPCISVRQLFPGEEELGLQGSLDFGNVKEKTPEGWEKCSSTIQYDVDTKLLWHELQKPYGNQSSFLRHLILLEKYFRNGDLVLSPNASHHSINYSESVHNRLRAYDNIPTNHASAKKSYGGIITTKEITPNVSIINAANIPKNTPITISQINNIAAPSAMSKSRNPGVPPGLISLQPGTSKPTTPSLIKVPHPQKIRIPLTKNWRPNLIPIDPTKKSDKDKKPGYVKVISGGKPYYITIEDYNRMCAIKKSYDLKQKRLMEAQNLISPPVSTASSVSQTNSILRSIIPRKGLVISKTATITNPKNDQFLSDGIEMENSLEKLDKTVENLESKLAECTSLMVLPKIPKSLTVIPQTVTHKPSRPSSPTVKITTKPKPSIKKS